MSYCVEYNPELSKRYPATEKRNKKPIKIVLTLLTLAVAVYVLLRSGVGQYLIPEDPGVTSEAFSVLVEHVQSGESIRESLLRFCEEIITGGK